MIVILVPIILTTVRDNRPDARDDKLDGEEDNNAGPEMPPPSLPPTIDIIHDRGYVRCRGDPDEAKFGSGLSLDLVSAIVDLIVSTGYIVFHPED